MSDTKTKELARLRETAPDTLFLVPDREEGHLYYCWCDDPAPSYGMKPSEAVEYVRKDVYDARIEAAEIDREAYRLEAERERALRAKMEEERDALAAQAIEFGKKSQELHIRYPLSQSIKNIYESVMKNKPEQALTRHDLLKQAGELDDLAAELKKHGHSDAAQTARIRAHVKRQRAQELGQ